MRRLRPALARLAGGLPLGFLRNLKWQYIATIGSGVLGGFYAIVISRVLGLQAFGLYSLCLSIATLIFNCGDLRLQEAAIRFLAHVEGTDAEARAHQRLWLLLLADAFFRIVALVILLALVAPIARLVVRDADAIGFLLMSGLVMFLSKAGNNPAIGILRAVDRFEWTAYLTLLDWGGRLVVTLGAALVWHLSIPIVLLLAAGVSGAVNLATVVLAIKGWRRKHGDATARPHLRDGEFWRFVASCYGISLSDNAAKELDSTLVGWMMNAEAVGIYRMTKNFVQIIWRASDPIFLVIMPEFKKLLQSGIREELVRFLRRIMVLVGVAAATIYAVSVIVMPWVVDLFLSSQFRPVIGVYPIMLSFIIVGMPLIWTHALLAAYGRPDIQLRANVLGNLLLVAGLAGLTPLFGVYGAAAGWSLGMTATFALSGLFLWRYMRSQA